MNNEKVNIKAYLNERDLWENWKCFIHMVDTLELLIIHNVLCTPIYDMEIVGWKNTDTIKHYMNWKRGI